MATELNRTLIEALVEEFDTWYHQIELPGGVITPGVNVCSTMLQYLDELGLPQDCTGMRVLDIGIRDGFFAFVAENRGAAEVLGIDNVAAKYTGIPIASSLLGSRVDYEVENVYDLSPDKHGTFDLVLFLGVLYHLRNPMLAIDAIRNVMKPGGVVVVESHVMDNHVKLPDGSVSTLQDVAPNLADIPLLQFHSRGSLNGDRTNKFSPNGRLGGMFEEARFEVQATDIRGARGYLYAEAVEYETLEYFASLDGGTQE